MRTFLRAAIGLFLAVGPSGGAPAGDLTLEWILDPANLRPLSTVRFLWLPDESLLLDDPRRPEGERTLERLVPSTLDRKPAGDREKILANWKSLVGEERAPRRVEMPSAAAAGGRTLLYERSGDLFLLDLESAAVRRLTNTEAEEKNPQFSPDGKLLSYVRDNDIFAIEAATGAERRLTRDGGETMLNATLSWVYWEEIYSRRDSASWWSPDSASILFLQSDDSPVAMFPLVDHEPSVPRVTWQRYPKAGGENPRVRAGIVDVETKAVRWIDLGSPEPEYIARAAWLPGGKSAALQTLNRAQNQLEVWLADRSSGRTRRIHEEKSSTWINLHDDLHFLPDENRFVWLSERHGNRHLYLHTVAGGPGVALTSGDWRVQTGGGPSLWMGSVAWIDAAAGHVTFHGTGPTPVETQVFRVGLDGRNLTKLFETESSQGGTHSATASPRGSYWIDVHSRTGVPPRVALHRGDGTLLQVLSPSAGDALSAFALTAPRSFTIPADDGTALPARLFEPAGLKSGDEEGRRYPAIVSIYGGPGSPTIADRWEGFGYLWNQLLARRGFAVFNIDPRSASDRGKALEDTVHRRFYGEVELKDILAGVRHLKSLPFIDPERVGIWGWSGGGTNTLYALTHSKEFRAGIAVAGVADQRYYDTIYTERYMGKPQENEEGYRSISPANAAADLHGRLLLVHGTFDDNVHPQSWLRMTDALVAAGKSFDLMIYPRRNHGIGDPAARRHLYRLMLDFWEKWLKGGTAKRV